MRSSDWSFTKDKRRLGKHFATRTMLLLKQYKAGGAVEVSIVVPSITSILGGLLTLHIRKRQFVPDLRSGERFTILRLGRTRREGQGYELFRGGTFEQTNGIVLLDISVSINGVKIQDVSIDTTSAYLEVSVPTAELPTEPSDLVVRLTTPSLYYAYNEPEPFTRLVIDLSLEVPFANLILLDLKFPNNYGLRGRIDNAEYLSFPLSMGDELLLYYFFFRGQNASVRCFLGDTDPSRLNAPALPLIATGVSLVALGYSLTLLDKQLLDMASTVYALSILPPVYQFLFRRRSFWPDPDLVQDSHEKISTVVALPCYGLLLLVTSLSMVSLIPRVVLGIDLLAVLNLVAGLFFSALFILYLCLLHIGFLQNFTCDFQEHRLRNRRRALLHIPTRKTVCQAHYEDLMAESVARNVGDKN